VIPTDVYASAEEFFDVYLSRFFVRNPRLTKLSWCHQWKDHFEAAEVVFSLWRSHEVALLTPDAGLGVWIRDYAYPLMDRLFDNDGTFNGCDWRENRHSPSGSPLK
jgi:hypothetical protein